MECFANEVCMHNETHILPTLDRGLLCHGPLGFHRLHGQSYHYLLAAERILQRRIPVIVLINPTPTNNHRRALGMRRSLSIKKDSVFGPPGDQSPDYCTAPNNFGSFLVRFIGRRSPPRRLHGSSAKPPPGLHRMCRRVLAPNHYFPYVYFVGSVCNQATPLSTKHGQWFLDSIARRP